MQVSKTLKDELIVLSGCIGRAPKTGLDKIDAGYSPVFGCLSQWDVIVYAQVALKPDNGVLHGLMLAQLDGSWWARS